jgi:hypothetical protein
LQVKAVEDGRLHKGREAYRGGTTVLADWFETRLAWQKIATALAGSADPDGLRLAGSITHFIQEMRAAVRSMQPGGRAKPSPGRTETSSPRDTRQSLEC